MADEITKTSDTFSVDIINELVTAKLPNQLVLENMGALFVDVDGKIKNEGGQVLAIPTNRFPNRKWQRLSDSASLETRKIEQVAGYAPVIRRGNAYAIKDIAELSASTFKQKTLNQSVADGMSVEVAMNMQQLGFLVLNGAIRGSGLNNVYDAGGNISVDAIIQSKKLLGDNGRNLKYAAFHSAQVAKLVADGVVEFKDAQTELGLIAVTGRIPTVAGVIIYETDDVPFDSATGKYTGFLFSDNSIYLGFQKDFNLEKERDTLAKADIISYDINFVYAPLGISYKNTAPNNPEDADLADPNNWELYYELSKQVGIVALESVE